MNRATLSNLPGHTGWSAAPTFEPCPGLGSPGPRRSPSLSTTTCCQKEQSTAQREPPIRPEKKTVIFFGWVFFLGSSGGQAPHVLRAHTRVHRTCGGPNGIELTIRVLTGCFTAPFLFLGLFCRRRRSRHGGTRGEPFNSTTMGGKSTSPAHLHARPTGRTCGEPGETKKNTHPKNITVLFREQGIAGYADGGCVVVVDSMMLTREAGIGTRRGSACSTPPPWGSSRFRPPNCTHAPWGCIVRVGELSPAHLHVLRTHMGVHRTCG